MTSPETPIDTPIDTANDDADQPSAAPEAPESAAAESDDAAVAPESADPERATTGGVALLEREGDIAADYLEVLLDIADLDGDIDIDVEGDRAAVSIIGDGLDRLVGPGGSTLDALQELTRLAVFKNTGEPSRLLLDIGGYREQRRKELAAVAKNAVEKVRELGEPVKLEPMSAFERKCVHDVVNASEGVASESEGVEPNRRIVVRPA